MANKTSQNSKNYRQQQSELPDYDPAVFQVVRMSNGQVAPAYRTSSNWDDSLLD